LTAIEAFKKPIRFAANYPLILIAAPVVLGLGVQALRKHPAEWSDVYVSAARTLLQGGDIYAPGSVYSYPPFPALLAIPFVPLPDALTRLAWYLINMAAVVYLARSAWALSGGKRLDLPEPLDRRELLVLAIGAVASVPYILNMLAHQQTDLVIAALVLSGCWAFTRRQPIAGAVLIGLGAAFKATPLLFAAYFAFRRNWIVAGAIVAVAIGVNILPDLVARPPAAGAWLGLWLERFVLPTARVGRQLGEWGTELGYNQSLAGTVQRLANTELVRSAGGLDIANRPQPIANTTLKLIAYGIMLSMLAVSAWAAARRASRTTAENASLPDLPDRNAVEFSIVLILMLMMSPMSGLAHFVVLTLPALCLARVAVVGHSRIAVSATAIACAGALAINKDLVGDTLYTVVLWSGLPTLTAIVLWLGCIGTIGIADPAGSGNRSPA
jgi:Glycosyltransferase family 87